MKKISAVYQIINSVTGDRYVGSSKNVMNRWANHKCPSRWNQNPNNPMYQDMQKYGVDKFRFQILAPVEPEYLTQVEQEFIDMLNPSYNAKYAKGMDVERHKETVRKYRQSEMGKEAHQRAWRKYAQSERGKEVNKDYAQSERGKEVRKNRDSQLCSYNGETLTFGALATRFYRVGIKHPALEAKKYLKEM